MHLYIHNLQGCRLSVYKNGKSMETSYFLAVHGHALICITWSACMHAHIFSSLLAAKQPHPSSYMHARSSAPPLICSLLHYPWHSPALKIKDTTNQSLVQASVHLCWQSYSQPCTQIKDIVQSKFRYEDVYKDDPSPALTYIGSGIMSNLKFRLIYKE